MADDVRNPADLAIAPRPGRGRPPRAVPLVVASAMFMEQLDGTVLSTALPSMARSFGVDPQAMSVALTSYLVSLAVFIPASGKVADRLGSRTVFVAAILLFTLGSILCAQSRSLGFLVAARLLQGAGGAMMVPVGRLVLLQTIEKSELISAMNWLLVPATLGPLLGPPVGGFLVTTLDWRWIFYINVPFGVVALHFAWRLIPDLKGPRGQDLDVAGMIFSGVALACLVFGPELARTGTAPRATIAVAAAGVACAALYARHARLVAAPVLDVGLMRIATFRISVLAGAATRIAVGATPYLLPLLLQLGLGMSAARSGLTTFVASIGSLAMRGLSRRLLRRFGYRRTMIWNGIGAACFALACATFRPGTREPVIYAVLFLGGFSQSLQFVAYNTIAYADIGPARMSAATSFYATMQQVTLTLGITVAAASVAASAAIAGHGAARLGDISAGFLTVAAFAILAPALLARLPANAGSELSGHRG